MRTRKWLSGDLVIPQEVLDDVDAHAREAYPGEACGLLSGPAGDPRAITSGRRMPNLADRYHQLDPETYPRTSREAYVIDGMAMQRALSDGTRTATAARTSPRKTGSSPRPTASPCCRSSTS
jgi:hypothetical protein